MNDLQVSMLVATDTSAGTILKAPKLGVFSDHPEEGAFVEPGACVGRIAQLTHRFQLVVPDGVSGRVTVIGAAFRARPVAYGEDLLRITPVTGLPRMATPRGVVSATVSGAAQILAPTDGVFYRAPATGAPPYVVVGERVKTGQPIGLIEVMKTFNPIAYGGAGVPDDGIVIQILVGDGQEVRAGDALIVVKASGS